MRLLIPLGIALLIVYLGMLLLGLMQPIASAAYWYSAAAAGALGNAGVYIGVLAGSWKIRRKFDL